MSEPCYTCGGAPPSPNDDQLRQQAAISQAMAFYRSENYKGSIIIHKRVNGSYGHRKPDIARGNREDIVTIYID